MSFEQTRDLTELFKYCSQLFHFPPTHSRSLEESSHAAAHHQEELLGEEDPGDLLQGGLGLTPQVQDSGSQERDAQAEAEEHAPVGESLPPVALKQRPDPLLEQPHVAPSGGLELRGAAEVSAAASCSSTRSAWSSITWPNQS